ncbi:MAG: TdeIII family type II restriction endonuclease [Cytophagales bacterium]|nr:MAG: TdeIII family type II restriction endonuclease [Cytophagales bacterium]
MAITNNIKQQIAIQVIRTLYNQFEKFPEDISNNRNAPFHEAFLNAFSDKLQDKVASVPIFISLSSWLHGLNTSLG